MFIPVAIIIIIIIKSDEDFIIETSDIEQLCFS